MRSCSIEIIWHVIATSHVSNAAALQQTDGVRLQKCFLTAPVSPSLLRCVCALLSSLPLLSLHFPPAGVGSTCRCLVPGAGLKTWEEPADFRREEFKETRRLFWGWLSCLNSHMNAQEPDYFRNFLTDTFKIRTFYLEIKCLSGLFLVYHVFNGKWKTKLPRNNFFRWTQFRFNPTPVVVWSR